MLGSATEFDANRIVAIRGPNYNFMHLSIAHWVTDFVNRIEDLLILTRV
jgi:hypothetical protein